MVIFSDNCCGLLNGSNPGREYCHGAVVNAAPLFAAKVGYPNDSSGLNRYAFVTAGAECEGTFTGRFQTFSTIRFS